MQRWTMGRSVISFAYAVVWINLFLCSYGKCNASITNIFEDFYDQTFSMLNKFSQCGESALAHKRLRAVCELLKRDDLSRDAFEVWVQSDESEEEPTFPRMAIVIKAVNHSDNYFVNDIRSKLIEVITFAITKIKLFIPSEVINSLNSRQLVGIKMEL